MIPSVPVATAAAQISQTSRGVPAIQASRTRVLGSLHIWHFSHLILPSLNRRLHFCSQLTEECFHPHRCPRQNPGSHPELLLLPRPPHPMFHQELLISSSVRKSTRFSSCPRPPAGYSVLSPGPCIGAGPPPPQSHRAASAQDLSTGSHCCQDMTSTGSLPFILHLILFSPLFLGLLQIFL